MSHTFLPMHASTPLFHPLTHKQSSRSSPRTMRPLRPPLTCGDCKSQKHGGGIGVARDPRPWIVFCAFPSQWGASYPQLVTGWYAIQYHDTTVCCLAPIQGLYPSTHSTSASKSVLLPN